MHKTKKKGGGINDIFERLASPVGLVYVSSYIPRRCGIATFTKDLSNAVNLVNPIFLGKIIAMDNGHTSKIDYPPEVKKRVRQEVWSDYKSTADYINKSNEIDLVSLQHEFGLYGGDMGSTIVDFMNLIKKPIVTTLHTVLVNPTDKQKKIIREIYKRSKYVAVMIGGAQQVLKEKYGLNSSKVVSIHHGVPDYPILDSGYWKSKLRLKDKVVMTSINLLSDGKGIEYAIQSIPKIIKEIPKFLYIVVGTTHPVHLKYLKKNFGHDVYRRKLTEMVKSLGIEKNVRFVNRYVSLKELVSFVGASDYYVTPYLDPQQAASGSLAYAIGAGKLCISTAYLYAKEMLTDNRGILVPFRNSDSIAEAVIRLYNNPQEKKQRELNTYEVGRKMTWIYVGHLYFHLFQKALIKS